MTFLYPLFEKGVILFLENPLGQLIGFFAMGIIFYAFTIKDDVRLIKVISFSNLFWMLHFLLLGNIGAFIATIVAMIRLYLSLKYKRSVIGLAFVSLLSIVLGTLFGFEGYISLIPIIATILASYAFFFLERLSLRIFLFLVSAMWLYYHIHTGSMSGVINELVVCATLILTIYRFIFAEERLAYKYMRRRWYRRRIFEILRRGVFSPPRIPKRINLGRFIYLRDKDRFK